MVLPVTVAWQWLMANRSRVFRWSTIFGGFAFVQALVQLLNAVAGFLLIRSLDKPNYAWFTIASTFAASLTILGDSGIGTAVTSIGGGVWRDSRALSSLIRAALRLRLRMAFMAAVAISPLSIWMLHKNGASLSSSVLLSVVVLAPVWHISTSGVLSVINRLHSRTFKIQIAELTPAFIRATLTVVFVLTGIITPFTALVALLVSHVCQYCIIRKQVAPYIKEPLDIPARKAFSSKIVRIMKQYYPNCIFICVQAQLTTWLISIFATTSEVADLGALNRLGIVFAIMGGPLTQFVAPAFARAEQPRRLRWIALLLVTGFGLFCLGLLGVSWYKGDVILMLLGENYGHLRQELILILSGMCIATMSAAVWALNMARGWVAYVWLNIPLTLFAQVVGALLVPLDTVRGLGWFAIITATVQLLHAAIVCLHGISHHQTGSGRAATS